MEYPWFEGRHTSNAIWELVKNKTEPSDPLFWWLYVCGGGKGEGDVC